MFSLKTFEQLTTDAITWVRAHTDKITDFAVGSKNRTLLEAVAIVVEELYQQVWQGLKTIIEETLYLVFDFPALPAKKATGVVVFSRATAAPQDYIIPAGTMVATEKTNYRDVVRFVTTETVTLLTGALSVSAPVEAEQAGLLGNVLENSIKQFVTKPVGVEAVNNSAKITGGTDAETPVDRKRRFRNYIAAKSKGTAVALEYGASQVEGIVRAKAHDSPMVFTLCDLGATPVNATEAANDPHIAAVTLLNSPVVIGDIVYFGAENKFSMLYFNIASNGADYSGVWEYYDGSAWQTLTVTDASNVLKNSGTLSFAMPEDWQDTFVEAFWGFWVRMRVTASTSGTAPTLAVLYASPPPGVVELYIQVTDPDAFVEKSAETVVSIESYRGAGIRVNILPHSVRTFNVNATIRINTVVYAVADIKSEVENLIATFCANLNMGDSFYQSHLISKILALHNREAVLSCVLTTDTGSHDILASVGELLVLGDVTVVSNAEV